MSEKQIVYIVVVRDRHTDDDITVHATRDAADKRVDEVKACYGEGRRGIPLSEWNERTSPGVRMLDTGDDGPTIDVERKTVRS